VSAAEPAVPQADQRRGMEPGVYEALTSAEYHLLPHCSNSRLSLLKRSPAHLLADLASPRPTSDAMRLGTAIHSAVLEPGDFAQRFTIAGRCEGTVKKTGEPCSNGGTHRVLGEWRCGVHPLPGARDEVEVLSTADLAVCRGVSASIHAHPKVGKLLGGPGWNELTVVWDDAESGVRCKARIDRLVEVAGGVLLDLKTTGDARTEAFERKVWEMGYHRQAALYADALAAHGVPTSHMVIVAAEKEAPFAVAGYRLDEVAADEGRTELRALLARYAECLERNEWPAYDTEIRPISLPRWAFTQGPTDDARLPRLRDHGHRPAERPDRGSVLPARGEDAHHPHQPGAAYPRRGHRCSCHHGRRRGWCSPVPADRPGGARDGGGCGAVRLQHPPVRHPAAGR
jgi:hypothetical protein